MPDRSRCSNCGQRVSPYAAGCAVCGADLDPARWDAGPGVGQRISSALNAISFGAVPGWLIVAFVVAVLVYLAR
jgi:hypothetical protein